MGAFTCYAGLFTCLQADFFVRNMKDYSAKLQEQIDSKHAYSNSIDPILNTLELEVRNELNKYSQKDRLKLLALALKSVSSKHPLTPGKQDPVGDSLKVGRILTEIDDLNVALKVAESQRQELLSEAQINSQLTKSKTQLEEELLEISQEHGPNSEYSKTLQKALEEESLRERQLMRYVKQVVWKLSASGNKQQDVKAIAQGRLTMVQMLINKMMSDDGFIDVKQLTDGKDLEFLRQLYKCDVIIEADNFKKVKLRQYGL